MARNSTLSGSRRTREINVRANILSEWTADQIRIRAEATKYAVGIVLSAAVLAVTVPISESKLAGMVAVQAKHEARLTSLKAELADATAAQKAAEPGAATAALRAQTSTYFDRMMGEAYAVLDAANSGMVFSSAKVEVRSAEIAIDCRAEAEDYDAAAAFARQAGSTPNEISSLASLRPNALLGPAGISFEYMKRVAVK